MDRKTGMYASLLTLIGVLGFAISMLTPAVWASYLTSMLIAWGFVPMIGSFLAFGRKDARAPGYTALAFSAVYAVLIMLVYFTQLTTVRLENLTEQARRILDYTGFGLLFSIDLLGYSFMALATFFIAFTIDVRTRRDKWLKALLLIHGVFAFTFILPILGVFHPGMEGGDLMGVIVLEFWCLYFVPVCILSFLHFQGKER